MADLNRDGSRARATASMLAARMSANSGFFVAVLLIARSLGPANRGSFAFVSVAALIVGSLAPLGIGPALAVLAAREPARRPELAGTAVGWGLLTGAVAGLLIILAGSVLQSHLPEGVDAFAIALAAIAAMCAATSGLSYSVLQGSNQFHRQAIVTGAAPWAYVAILVAARLTGNLDLHTAIAAWMLYWAMLAAGGVVVAALTLGLGRPRPETIRASLGFGARAWFGTLSLILNARVDQVLMGFLATEAALGIYAVAVNVSEVLLYLPAIVGTVLLPAVASSAPERTLSTTTAAARQLLLVTAVCGVVAAVLAPPLIPLVFGDAFAGAVTPFLWLLPGTLGYALLIVFASALTGSGLPGRSSAAWLIALLTGVALDLALMPRFGADGAAAAASAAFVAGGAAAVLAFRRWRHFPVRSLAPRPSDARDVLASGRAVLRRGRAADSLRLRSAPAGMAKSALVGAQAATWRVRRRPANDGLRILFYHRVSADHDQLAVSPRRFRHQMEAIARSGLQVLDLEAISPEALPRSGIVLTFDDGYRDFAENALPVLAQHGFPATVFVCPALIAGQAWMPWYRRDRQPPLLAWDEMRAIEAAAPVRFEPHTMSHPDLTRLPDEEAAREIADSRDVVARELGRETVAFCYPGGYAGEREARLARDAGFVFGLTCEAGLNGPGADPMLLRRTPVDRYDRDWLFRARLRGATDAGPPLRRARAASPERASLG
jgi:O-antigen/teichoic acid export membrane protein/peptidoglycan/xylan/chitin deacetylase (PgdA/CDA1 family)